MQERLTTLGFPVESDGYFGQDTHNAVGKYQKPVGLVPDGHVGIQTWLALLDEAPNMLVYDIDGNGVVLPDEVPFGE